ncbi:MAG: hypothetical protein COS95_03515 [Ignavibacteriales bacterium CG07_land_8_20_14_0_80_59_12]|nr:MAG: hypothetical protein COS95_03515 [Ignavibacteriales bacterium CG07_land_8_20_14_0_80_59_12]
MTVFGTLRFHRRRSELTGFAPRLFVVVIFSFLFPLLSVAQVAFDVKTTLEEKRQLHVIKIAVINALHQSNWATVKGVGENYSLWLTNLKRHSEGDSIKTEFDLDLRTPAMLSRGRHITSAHVSVLFDTTSISNVRSSNDTLINGLVVQGLESSGVLKEFSKFFSSSIPFGDLLIRPFVSKVLDELSRQPTPLESLEANLLAAQAIIQLRQMTQEDSRRK